MSICHAFGPMTFSGLGTGKSRSMGVCAFSVAALPTDPIGSFTLTLTNVIVGSAIQISSQVAGTSLYNGTAATSSPTINLSCYAGGNSNDLNNLKVKVRKASAAPFYQPYTTLMTAFVGGTSHYVNQLPDQR